MLLVGWALVVLVGWLSYKYFGPPFWKDMVPVTLELAVGWGLLRRRRWGWMLGIATAALFIADGLRLLIFHPGSYAVMITVLIHRLIPAAVVLVCLLPLRARRPYLAGS